MNRPPEFYFPNIRLICAFTLGVSSLDAKRYGAGGSFRYRSRTCSYGSAFSAAKKPVRPGAAGWGHGLSG